MLCRISSHELSEWAAYEAATGPLDGVWSDDMLAAIHEQIQALRLAMTNAEGTSIQPIRVPRPNELHALYAGQHEAEGDEDELSPEEEQAATIVALNAAIAASHR